MKRRKPAGQCTRVPRWLFGRIGLKMDIVALNQKGIEFHITNVHA
jgi:hypothetical protein